ncbi:hypothetical protein fugu_003835 [Takifugu bimaculatus]|uniref:Phosphoinositide-3-kinase-interacting protein 1 n=1 Tax=Takifugu bimaculatus TaxID=433685 RepID=A0A4Z2BAZ4_9TELE|nr:hypothetical protein fugu_003835 [Takifugu bimaculatus]
MWRSVENRGKKKTNGTSKHGSPSSKANKGNCFVAVATEILGFVYDCGLTVGLTGVVYASEEASDVPPEAKSFHPAGLPSSTESLQPASSASSQGEPAAVQPVIGISQRVHTGPKKKKDLGPSGYVLGILMIAIIITLGAGITFGYLYKRGRDLKKQHEQRVYEREMQRINLPLSAFSNPTCELVDENTIVITAEHEATPVQEDMDGEDPLMGQQAGTPGA